MITHTLLLSLFLCTNLYFSNAQVQCGGVSCSSTDSCCDDLVTGYRCYNPALSDCVVNDAGQSVLCGEGLDACGSMCYNSSQFICETGEILCGYRQGQAIKACGSSCYDPTSYGCCNGALYSVNSPPASCVSTGSGSTSSGSGPLFCSAFVQTSCPNWCCDATCYDPTQQTCFDNQVCPLGNEVCDGTCFDPNTQECCNGELFAFGTSVCSEPTATCCSCACNSQTIAVSGTFTVGSSAQCNSAYIGETFPDDLNCPSFEGSCSGTDSCNINCNGLPMWWDRCDYDAGYGCGGTNYICGGGNFTCSVSANAECPAPVSTTYESGYNTTQIPMGTTSYAPVPQDYAGEVCCWCSSASEGVATSTIVPDVASCNVGFVVANDYVTSSSDLVCQVWSTAQFYTPARLACGLPES